MFEKIIYISETMAHVKINTSQMSTNLMNLNVIFEEEKTSILGEIVDINDSIIKVKFLGEFIGDKFIAGVIRKPTFASKIRIINNQEIDLLVGSNAVDSFYVGKSPLYGKNVNIPINSFFSNHMAIFGNSGSGKSFGFARLLQNVFENQNFKPYRANFMIFDAYGEYHSALSEISKLDSNFHFKFYTTNPMNGGYSLAIPIWLLDLDDLALLLQVTNHGQLPIIETMLKLVRIFASDQEEARRYKNYLIAKAIMNILFTNQTASSKRNDIFSILNTCSTNEFNSEAPVKGVGYVRKFRECLTIDTQGNFSESILLNEYVASFIDESLDKYEVTTNNYYTLEDLEKALNFTLISEGMLKNDKSYADAILLKVRLHSLTIGGYAKYFNYKEYVTLENYIANIVAVSGKKAQIVNFNLVDVDDWFAKAVVKIYSKMLFKFTKSLNKRASIPFHIILEEAHRYVQNDTDNFILGYNIFERIAKEGRKYGLILNLISQRPVELSETVISQCSNFLIFKTNHPRDVEYVRQMLPNISNEIVEKQKTLQPGVCIAYGSSFRIPIVIKMDLPNPAPNSSNSDVFLSWQNR